MQIKLSLYGKLLLLALSLEAILGIVLVFGFSAFNKQNDRDKFRHAETLLLQCYHYRAEFAKKRDMTIKEKFAQNIRTFNSIIDPFMEDPSVKQIDSLKSEYEKEFYRYVKLMEDRGINENLGIEGNFRKRVHEVEDIIKTIGRYRIYTDMLQARRSEKDFIMRRKDMYITRVENAVSSLISNTKSLDISDERKREIINLSKAYINSFYSLVEIFQSLDSSAEHLSMLENRLQNDIELVVEKEAQKAEMSQNFQLFISIFSLLLGIMLSIFIAKSISNPVVKLQKAALKISEGDFGAQADVKTNDEIGQLAQYFNTMSTSVHKSHETIMEQQEQLREQNIELEMLAEELRSSFNNLSILSNFGRSITRAIRFDDLFSRLSEELTVLIDTSTLGIGIVDEHNLTINYKVVIRRSSQSTEFTVDLTEKDRFDVLSIANNAEILINDILESRESFNKEEYPFLSEGTAYKTIEENASSIFYVPVKAEDKVIGIMALENTRKNSYKSHHLDMVRNLSSYIAIALMNTKAYEEIRIAHDKIRKAQAQLIQAEKMASLGQLTTGIAHEIKNPLNFIKNYSEGTLEICNELGAEIENLNGTVSEKDKENLKETINEIGGYLDTITKNSRRIDNIVKTMMEHSRGSAGEKSETDIPIFLQEYVKLAYHGFRGQYKDFNANIKYNFPDSLPKVEIRQQDMSRVITNIVDNACYAMRKKAETGGEYMPELKVSAAFVEGLIAISIEDNGTGIPDEVLEKIFNPFFTTKPTGEGTGLGLSLSYDIVTCGHGGEMKINTEKGMFTEFIIKLPSTEHFTEQLQEEIVDS